MHPEFACRAFVGQEKKTDGGKTLDERPLPIDEMDDQRHTGGQSTQEKGWLKEGQSHNSLYLLPPG